MKGKQLRHGWSLYEDAYNITTKSSKGEVMSFEDAKAAVSLKHVERTLGTCLNRQFCNVTGNHRAPLCLAYLDSWPCGAQRKWPSSTVLLYPSSCSYKQ